MNVRFGVPSAVRFNWDTLISPVERAAGWLHLLPSQHELIIDLEGKDKTHPHALFVDRPEDMLSLRFEFENMRLHTGFEPAIVRIPGAGEPRVKVIFPPQHTAEQAFFHTEQPGVPETGLPKANVPIGPTEWKDYYNKPPTAPDPTAMELDKLQAKYDPDNGSTTSERDLDMPGTVLSGETRLVFGLKPHDHEIPCHIEALLDWSNWLPIVAPVAVTNVDQRDPLKVPGIAEPTAYTAIEMPYRLYLSPSELGRWAHSLLPVVSEDKRVIELWHTRLSVAPRQLPAVQEGEEPKSTIADEANSKDRTVRAIWSPDFEAVGMPRCDTTGAEFRGHYSSADPPNPPSSPFRMSLDARDRSELVHLTSNYAITQQIKFCTGTNPQLPALPLVKPAPVQINNLMLTAMGGYLDAIGQWNPMKVDLDHQLTVQLWKHHATLGRDHYVKVLYKGYLMPFGLRASLVKVTQRYFQPNAAGNWVAILHQHMYIVVKNERRQFPLMGQPFDGRAFPCSYVEPVTLVTPFLNDPTRQPWPKAGMISQSQSLFWPTVGTDPFHFRVRFTDATGVHSVESSMPLVFAGSDVAQHEGSTSDQRGSQDAVRLYNGGAPPPAIGAPPPPNGDDPWLTADFSGQKFAFAQSTTPGDTDFDTSTMVWTAVPLLATVSVTVANAAAGAYLTFAETISGQTVRQDIPVGRILTVSFPSGSYRVTVTTPQNAGPPRQAVSGASQYAGNATYSLSLTLDNPPIRFTGSTVPVVTGSTGLSAIDLYHYDLPYFYPAVNYARLTSASIKRITGNTDPTRFSFYSGYLSDGFSAKTNPGEVVLQKDAQDKLTLAFGATKSVDQSGGLASPDVLVAGFSRKTGPVGGRQTPAPSPGGQSVNVSVTTFSSGKFDAADFFSGLLSAKLLGAVKLSDIITPLASDLISNLEKAPQMLEQAVYSTENAVAQYIQAGSDQLQKFQNLNPNPLATALSSQAQAVFDAAGAVKAASGADPITIGVLEAQAIARFADYGAALEKALQNPAPLVEDAILQALTKVFQDAIGNASDLLIAQLNLLADKATVALDNAIQSLVNVFDPIATAMAVKINDTFTKAMQLRSTLAPEIAHLVELKNSVEDLDQSISALGKAVRGAAVQPLSLQQIPAIVSSLADISDALRQVYQKAGYVGIAVSQLKADNPTVRQALDSAQSKLLGAWNSLPHAARLQQYGKDLSDFQVACNKLASQYDPVAAKAQLILQNFRQLQSSVNQAIAAVQNGDTNDYRRLQVLQKSQAHILKALSALQGLARVVVPPTALSAAVDAGAQDLAGKLTMVAELLPVAGSVETLILTVTSDSFLKKPLAAKAAELRDQLATLRAQILASPDDLGLKVLYYNLSIDYQRPVAAAEAYALYLQSQADAVLTAAFDKFVQIVAPIEALALQAQQSLCALQPVWASLRAAINNAQGPLLTTIGFGQIINSLFGRDMDAIDADFANLCNAAQATPSEFLRNVQSLAAGFVTLEKDIRAKAGGIPAQVEASIEAAVLAQIKQEAQKLLDQLLNNVPIPTSASFSYTWNPSIQSFEPVFIVDDGGSFTVTASAQAGLNSTLNGISASFDIRAELTNFEIRLIGDAPFITLVFDSVTFTSHNGAKPDCQVKLRTVEFGEALNWVRELADALDPTDGPFIELADGAIRAGFRFAVSSMTVGAFNLMQLAIEVAVALPFDGTPVRCEFSLSDQETPFLLSCGIYGGGGFLQLQLGLDGVQLLQGALEFGVCASISIGPIEGSGFCVAGIYFRITASDAEVCGFVHAHGHMDIFGLISMDIDVYVGVCYDKASNSVIGTATFSVSVSIGFFSESFSMQASYVFAGSSPSSSLEPEERILVADLEPPGALPPNWTGDSYALAAPGFSAVPAALGLHSSARGAAASHATAKQATAKEASCKGKTLCPAGKNSHLFIDQPTWSKYFNSFIK